jgi:hypothetical protein
MMNSITTIENLINIYQNSNMIVWVGNRMITSNSIHDEMFTDDAIYKVGIKSTPPLLTSSDNWITNKKGHVVGLQSKPSDKPHMMDQIIAMYTQTNKNENRFQIEVEEAQINIDNIKGKAIYFKVIDTVTGKEIDPPATDLIRSVAQMNAEDAVYKSNLNEFITPKNG